MADMCDAFCAIRLRNSLRRLRPLSGGPIRSASSTTSSSSTSSSAASRSPRRCSSAPPPSARARRRPTSSRRASRRHLPKARIERSDVAPRRAALLIESRPAPVAAGHKWVDEEGKRWPRRQPSKSAGGAAHSPSAERAPRVFLPLASIKPLDGSESQEEIEKKERKLLKAVMTTLMAVKLQRALAARAHAARHPQKGQSLDFVY